MSLGVFSMDLPVWRLIFSRTWEGIASKAERKFKSSGTLREEVCRFSALCYLVLTMSPFFSFFNYLRWLLFAQDA